MQHRDARSRDLQLGNRAARQALFVQLDEAVERSQVVFGERQLRLGLEDVDAGDGDIQLQAADRFGELRLREASFLIRDVDPNVALAAALEWDVHADRVLWRPRGVYRVEAGAQPVQALRAGRQDRVGPQPGSDRRSVGNRQVGPFGKQGQVVLDRFGDGTVDGQTAHPLLGGEPGRTRGGENRCEHEW